MTEKEYIYILRTYGSQKEQLSDSGYNLYYYILNKFQLWEDEINNAKSKYEFSHLDLPITYRRWHYFKKACTISFDKLEIYNTTLFKELYD